MEMAQQQQISGLHDNAVSKTWSNAKCAIAGTDFDKTVCEVWRSVTAQYSFGDGQAPSYETIERVINAFMDLQKDPFAPELNFEASTTAGQNANTALVNQVAVKAGVDVKTTQQALEQLYFASKQGRIPNERVLYPRRFASEGDPRDEKSTLEKTLKIAGGVAIGVGVCFGIYYVAKVYNLFSTSKTDAA